MALKKDTEENLKKQEEIILATPDYKSDAKRIKVLFNRYKTWKNEYYKTTRLKEPVLLFERRNGDIEIYEEATKGKFEFKHSDGEDRYIIIDPAKKKRFSFTNPPVMGYIAHEDHPVAGWPDPYITTEQFNLIIEKAASDYAKWKAKVLDSWTNLIQQAGIAVGLIILAYTAYRMFIHKEVDVIATKTTAEVVYQTATNMTEIIKNNITPTIV